MKVYKDKSREIYIPKDVNLTELLHTSAVPLAPSHLIASDSLTNRSLTIGELRSRAGRIANGLRKSYSPVEGDRWAVILPNCVEYIELFHALLWVGGVGCPINHALKAIEIAHALAVSRPKYIFAYSASLANVLEGIRIAKVELAQTGTTWKDPTVMTVINRHGTYAHAPDDFISSQTLAIPHYGDTTTRLASIHLSSGTTGAPKGVQLTHYNFVANVHQLYAHDPAQFHPAARIVAFTPFVHIAMTTMPLFFGPWTGALHHAMPAPFSFEEFGKLVSSVRPTSFQGVPSIALQIANSDLTEKYDFSNAEVINCGGAGMTPEIVARLCSRAPWEIIQVYGMTEGAPYVAYQRKGQRLPGGQIGHFLPNVEAMLKVSGTSEDAPEGGPGELWIRGPNITQRYSGVSTEANTRAFPEEDGLEWYNTGDVCTIDKNGVVSVVGRTKELIKYKGFQVSPVELEAHLNSHSHVVEAGVGAVWDKSQLTELPTAYVVLKPELADGHATRALEEIHQQMDQLVSGYKKLRGGVWGITKLSKTSTGKILRAQLREHLTGACSLHSEPQRAKL
ncbi:AMP-binding enzyme [Cucurbitaria berberidis CBS 394.84]|uniref:AMP-binding enzyme n=1 Tax=Cucurbitaria berberidis CBS 394.84 TaxID=1168544 RepID=A0A9P4GGK0_9PLEO|nr:AMP-binding enzyme [Cucurbitaria berberidis CBS 394.84]KAF1844962.1 AMP-binding enzyme [Cucurbitaria berberidis CBS 394.84]